MTASCQKSVATSTSAAGRTPNWNIATCNGMAAASNTHPDSALTGSARATVNMSETSATPCADMSVMLAR